MQQDTLRRRPLLGTLVLVVDDDDDARELAAYALHLAGARVHVSHSAADAVRALDVIAPDVLLSDIAMPGEDGLSLVRRVRQRGGSTGKVVAVAFSSFATEPDRERAQVAGYDDLVAKASSIQGLVTTIRRMLDLHAARLSGRTIFRIRAGAEGADESLGAAPLKRSS